MRVKGTTKAGGQKHNLDKFYTKPEIATQFIQKLNLDEFSEIIEPSAGSGSFSNQIEGCVAYDLAPEHPTIINANWFDIHRDRDPDNRILVIGNPPFGQQNSLAVKFINHAALFADTIAFILPLSFMKEGVQKRLHPNLHLTYHERLPKNSFLLEGKDMDVPCVFQIWTYDSSTARQTAPNVTVDGVTFVKKADNPDCFIQRVGGRAGSAGVNWEDRSEQSNYFLKLETPWTPESFVKAVNELDFAERDLSVGPRSLSKQELLRAILLAI